MSNSKSISRTSFTTGSKSLETSTAPVKQQRRTSFSSQPGPATRSGSITPTEHPGRRVSLSDRDSDSSGDGREGRDSAASVDARGSGTPLQSGSFEPLEPLQTPVLEAAGRKPFTPLTRAARSPVSDGPTSEEAIDAFFNYLQTATRYGQGDYALLPTVEAQFQRKVDAYLEACEREGIAPEALREMDMARGDMRDRLSQVRQRNPETSSESGAGSESPSHRSTARQLDFGTPAQHQPGHGPGNDDVLIHGPNASHGDAFARTEAEIIVGLVKGAMAPDPAHRAQGIRTLLELYGDAADSTRSRFHDAAFAAAREAHGELPPALAFLAAKARDASAPTHSRLLEALKIQLKSAIKSPGDRDILGHRLHLDIELLAGTDETFLPSLPVHRTVINRQPRSIAEAESAEKQATTFLESCRGDRPGTVRAALTFDQHHWMPAFVQRTDDGVQIYVFNEARRVSGTPEKIETDTLGALRVAADQAKLKGNDIPLGISAQEAGIQHGCGVIAYDLFKYVNARLAEGRPGMPTPHVGGLITEYMERWKAGLDEADLHPKERIETVVRAELFQAASTYVDEEMERSLGENQRDLVGKLKEQVKEMTASGMGGRPLPARVALLREACVGFSNVMSVYDKKPGDPLPEEIENEHRLLVNEFFELCASLQEIVDLSPITLAAVYLDLPLDHIDGERDRRVQSSVHRAQIARRGATSPLVLLTPEIVRARADAPVRAWVDAALKRGTTQQELAKLRATAVNAAVGARPNPAARKLFDDAFGFNAQQYLAGKPDKAGIRQELAAKLQDSTFNPVRMDLVTVDQNLAESMYSEEFGKSRAETRAQATQVLGMLMQLHLPQGAPPVQVREAMDELNVTPLIKKLTVVPNERLDDTLEDPRDAALDDAYKREMVAHYTPLLETAQRDRPDDVMRLRNNIENELRNPRTGDGAYHPAVLTHFELILDLLPLAGAQFGPALTAPVHPGSPKLVAAQKKAQNVVGGLIRELAKNPGSRKANRQQARFQAAINRLVKTAGGADAQRRQVEQFVNHIATPRELFTLHIQLWQQVSRMPAGQSRANAALLLDAIDKRVFAWSRKPEGAEIIWAGLQEVPELITESIDVVDYLVAKVTAPVAHALTDKANVDGRRTPTAVKLDQKAAALAKIYGDAVRAFTARSLAAAQDLPALSHNGFINALAVAHRALSELTDEGFNPVAQQEIRNANAEVESFLGAMPDAWWSTMTDAQLQRAQAEISGLGIAHPQFMASTIDARVAAASVAAVADPVALVDERGRPLNAAALAARAAVRPVIALLDALRNKPDAGAGELRPALDALRVTLQPMRDAAGQIEDEEQRRQFVGPHIQGLQDAIAEYVTPLPEGERIALQQALRNKIESPGFEANRQDLHLAHIAVNEVVHAQELKDSSIAAQAAAQHVFELLKDELSTPAAVSDGFDRLDRAIRPFYMIHGAGPTPELVNDHRELVYRTEVGALLGQLLQEHEKASPKGLHDVRKQLDAKLGSSRFKSVRKQLEFARRLVPAPSLKEVLAGTDKKALAHRALFGKVRDLMLAVADPSRLQPGRRMNEINAEVRTATEALPKLDRTLTFDAVFTAHVDHHLASFAETAAGTEQLRNLHLRLAMVSGEGRRGLTHEENLIQQALTRMLDNAPVNLASQVFGSGFVESVAFLTKGFEASVEGLENASLQSELVTRLGVASRQLVEFTKVALVGQMVNIDQQVSAATEALSESLENPEPAYWESMTSAQLTTVQAALTSVHIPADHGVLAVVSEILANRATERGTAAALVREFLDSLSDKPFIAADALAKITSEFGDTLGSTENSHAVLSRQMTEYVDAMREPQRTALQKTVRAKLSSTEFALSHAYLALAHRALTEEIHGETINAAREKTAGAAEILLDTLAEGIDPERTGNLGMFPVRIANKLQVMREAASPIADQLAITENDRAAIVQRELESAVHQRLGERKDVALLRGHLQTAIDSPASAPVRHHLLFVRDQLQPPASKSGPLVAEIAGRGAIAKTHQKEAPRDEAPPSDPLRNVIDLLGRDPLPEDLESGRVTLVQMQALARLGVEKNAYLWKNVQGLQFRGALLALTRDQLPAMGRSLDRVESFANSKVEGGASTYRQNIGGWETNGRAVIAALRAGISEVRELRIWLDRASATPDPRSSDKDKVRAVTSLVQQLNHVEGPVRDAHAAQMLATLDDKQLAQLRTNVDSVFESAALRKADRPALEAFRTALDKAERAERAPRAPRVPQAAGAERRKQQDDLVFALARLAIPQRDIDAERKMEEQRYKKLSWFKKVRENFSLERPAPVRVLRSPAITQDQLTARLLKLTKTPQLTADLVMIAARRETLIALAGQDSPELKAGMKNVFDTVDSILRAVGVEVADGLVRKVPVVDLVPVGHGPVELVGLVGPVAGNKPSAAAPVVNASEGLKIQLQTMLSKVQDDSALRSSYRDLRSQIDEGVLLSLLAGADKEAVATLMMHLPSDEVAKIAGREGKTETEREIVRIASLAHMSRGLLVTAATPFTAGENTAVIAQQLLQASISLQTYRKTAQEGLVPVEISSNAGRAAEILTEKAAKVLPENLRDDAARFITPPAQMKRPPERQPPPAAGQRNSLTPSRPSQLPQVTYNILDPQFIQVAGLIAAKNMIVTRPPEIDHAEGAAVSRATMGELKRVTALFKTYGDLENTLESTHSGRVGRTHKINNQTVTIENLRKEFHSTLQAIVPDANEAQRNEIADAVRGSGLEEDFATTGVAARVNKLRAEFEACVNTVVNSIHDQAWPNALDGVKIMLAKGDEIRRYDPTYANDAMIKQAVLRMDAEKLARSMQALNATGTLLAIAMTSVADDPTQGGKSREEMLTLAGVLMLMRSLSVDARSGAPTPSEADAINNPAVLRTLRDLWSIEKGAGERTWIRTAGLATQAVQSRAASFVSKMNLSGDMYTQVDVRGLSNTRVSKPMWDSLNAPNVGYTIGGVRWKHSASENPIEQNKAKATAASLIATKLDNERLSQAVSHVANPQAMTGIIKQFESADTPLRSQGNQPLKVTGPSDKLVYFTETARRRQEAMKTDSRVRLTADEQSAVNGKLTLSELIVKDPSLSYQFQITRLPGNRALVRCEGTYLDTAMSVIGEDGVYAQHGYASFSCNIEVSVNDRGQPVAVLVPGSLSYLYKFDS